MSQVDFQRVRSVFLAARDLDDTGRAELLHQECDDDPTLRTEVESLLAHHDAEQARATTPLVGDAVEAFLESRAPAREETLPRRFGGFELLEIIGRGGMGTVYRARQRTPDRTVALKVIRPGMMTSSMRGRFRYEADVLARLQHPGIARIFEAGAVASERGEQPYFALELVAGEPIDDYARTRDLDVRQRMEMMISVCDAVHHAHQKGVIHRDLKPANILVDADGQPKILDFGVARAVDADLRATTLRTEAGQLIGTLPYMSPEQLSGDPSRLDVRSDVYALGVLVFELLADRLPHDLHEKTIADAALAIRDDAPARLSEVDPDLRGDLETITGKALEKDPSRRYASAAALAEDLRRYLAHQPLIARPPSMAYQLRLFARRHRALMAGGTLAAAALVLATAVSIVFAVVAQQAANREARQRQIAERTNEYLEGMLTLPDPHRGGEATTVADMLDLILARLDSEPELPEVEAKVRGVIGRTLVHRAEFDRAIDPLERAVELWRDVDPVHLNLPEALVSLGNARIRLGDGDAGEVAYREAIAMMDRHGQTEVEDVRATLLSMLVRRQKLAEAHPLARELVAAARRHGDPVRLIAMLRQLTKVESGMGAHEAAAQTQAEAQRLAERHLPETHPMHTGLRLDVGVIRMAQGDLEGALDATRVAFEYAEQVRKPGSYDWQICLTAYAHMLEHLDRHDELIEVLAEARTILVGLHGPDDDRVRDLDERMARLREPETTPAPP